ncbi:uncharacterized protein LOC105209311 [Zeugodacus cucurbitae]|uniref:uncharacterized protein LOC105209311 n=1 Tax=Zeugodacus cucurbitae TaxID=28588 RepID=UPI0023D93129|nr:uncharacterized protein LOC105209311 [Zeugodacus cucurbitae]
MLKSKSFRINHEIDKKPKVHELLYETKRVRWMKCLVIPLLIAFSLLLVLSNVNFSGESYELVVAPPGESQTIATQMPTNEVSTIANINYETTMEYVGLDSVEGDGEEKKGDGGKKEADGGEKEEDGTENDAGDAVHVAVQYWDETLSVSAAKSFTCTDNHSCKTIICTGGPIYNVFNEIEYFVDWCGHLYFDVVIEDCTFNKNTIDKYTFSGNFKMIALTIKNCQLNTIVDNAFMYQSTNVLTNITFDGVQLKALNPQTFNGLEAVKNFKLFNVLTQTTSPLNANNFLQPMAATLTNLVLQQTEESNTIYDPTAWLGGNSISVYHKLLYVDLSGTKFNDTLNGNTFAKLAVVQELRLANCSLSTIAENVFNDILSTLKSLDLRNNRLQTLDGQFLATAIGKGINIEFGRNLWSCDCDNVEIIEYMKKVQNTSATATVCATPTELQGVQIGNAKMRCDDTTTLVTIITTVITTAAATTNIPTTIMKTTTNETTASDPETQPISSSIAIDNSTLSPASSDTTVIPTFTDDTTEETTVSIDPTASASSATSTTVATTSVTANNATNSTVPTSSPATTEGTDVSESTDLTPPTTINITLAPTTTNYTTTPNVSTIASTTTIETKAPPSSLMTSTIEADTTMETAESTPTTTPQLTSTTLILFPGTTIIPMPTIITTETVETTSKRTDTTKIQNTTTNKPNFTTTTEPATMPPTVTTCFNESSPKFLVCTDIIAIRLCDYDATFKVVPLSARSVQLQIGKNESGLQAIYFQALNNTIIEEIDVGNKSSIDIVNLTPNRSYTFCLIPKGETSTSPFNCRSAHLPSETSQPWLAHSDVALFCTIAILITVVCVIVGVALIYYLLRWRPTLLHGNKRLRRIASASHEVLLFPKPDRTSVDSKTHALNALSKMHSSVSDTLTPENYLNIKSYDYMQYFKNAELEKQRRVAHISLNQPPVQRAPALPPNVGGVATRRDDRLSYSSGYLPVRAISQQSTVVLEATPQPPHSMRRGAAARLPPEPVEVLENEYESLEYYQELY